MRKSQKGDTNRLTIAGNRLCAAYKQWSLPNQYIINKNNCKALPKCGQTKR